MIKFPKSERVNFLLRQDLADRIPKENPERRKFLNRAVAHELDGPNAVTTYLSELEEKGGSAKSEVKAAAVIMGSAKSEKKTAAARENAKKPRPNARKPRPRSKPKSPS
jgi:hypothetical protein